MSIAQSVGALSSGAGGLLAAFAAWYAIFFIKRKAIDIEKERQFAEWTKEFATLYEEFWKNPDIKQVRKWLVHEEEYRTLETVLEHRLSTPENCLSSEEYDMLEKVDQFCALMARISLFDQRDQTPAQSNAWEAVHYRDWLKLAQRREQLRKYIDKYWPSLLGKF
jgi:hypothetical protein